MSVYSLKGPAHPEKIVNCSFAICCITFHSEWSHLLATGCEGGFVNVYDLRREENSPAGTNKMTEKIVHHDKVSTVSSDTLFSPKFIYFITAINKTELAVYSMHTELKLISKL